MLWLSSLFMLFSLDLAIAFWRIVGGMMAQTFLYTGLFITAHDAIHAGYDNPHHAKSNDFHPIVSFLTCYHFGYHWEHHEYPGIPWWRLPAVRSGKCSVRSYEKL
ncbi:MAG: hypothetical protein EHM72_11965 [Calditrichaeota bacterium]|nr:MAG: hypothetical protein EHM72_11965 [Calditrichota bacterium]